MTASPPRVWCIDGEIGAGKTTLIKLMEAHLQKLGYRVVVIPEPVELWQQIGVLQKFYEDPKGMAYAFQSFTFLTRIKETLRVVEQVPDADIYIMERSVVTDKEVFMRIQRDSIDPVYGMIYDELWGFWTRLLPFQPDTWIYVKPSIEVCMQRVEMRHRDGESFKQGENDASGKGGVGLEYQLRLREAHERFLQSGSVVDPARVLVVPEQLANSDFTSSDDVIEWLMSRLLRR